ncbi:hypothetical protein SLA2020_502150 [Shorea laevis]
MRFLNLALIVLFLSAVHLQPFSASRLLHGESKAVKMNLVLQSLDRQPTPPSGPSGCTNIPGTGGPSCHLEEKHFAGDALPRAKAYPRLTAQFGVATNQK